MYIYIYIIRYIHTYIYIYSWGDNSETKAGGLLFIGGWTTRHPRALHLFKGGYPEGF